MGVGLPLQAKLLGGCALIALLSWHSAARAQEASGGPVATPSEKPLQVGEIVVTARKRNERVLDIPESISAISSQAIVSKGIEKLDDVGRQTSNLQLNTRQDLTTDVVIRGVGAFGDVLGVGFTIDDAPNFTDQSMRVEDLDSIEVLKGPQGTLYGGSSIGGEIIYHSKQPSFDWKGQVTLEGGSYDTINASIFQNIPIIDDKLAMRISASEAQSHGYVENSALGIDGSPSRNYALRAAFLFKPAENFDASLVLRHSYIVNGADEYTPVTSVRNFAYDAPLFEPTYNKKSTYGAVLKLDDHLGDYLLTSISSYTRAQSAQNVDISFTPPGTPGQVLMTTQGNRPAEVTTQEIRLSSPQGHSVDWLIGVYADQIKNILLNQNQVASYPPPSEISLINDFNTNRVDVAAFGTLNYHIGDLTLGAGLRLGRTKFKANVFVEAGGLPDQSNSITSDAVLPKFSISYKLPDGGLIYANVAKGEEPGAVNTVSTAPIPFRSEKATSYEVGIKGRAFDRRVEYELASFYVSNTKHQLETNQYIASEGGLVTLINNIGDSRTYGVEGSATWRATHDLTFSANGGYLNARWTKALYFGSPIDGKTIPNAPEITANLSAEYSKTLSNDLRISANLDASYTDKFWWDLPNTPGSAEPSYWMVNSRLALAGREDAWELAIQVSNLLDEKYWTEFYPNFFNGVGAYPACATCNDLGSVGAPREVMASITFKY